MYRGSPRGSEREKENIGLSRASQMSKIQPQGETIQRQVQRFTRKLEEEKKRLFRVQENHKQALQDYQNKVAQFEKCKSKKSKNEMSALSAKLKFYENSLKKGITAYNQALSQNNSLKSEINELRKERKSQMQTFQALNNEIEEMHSSINNIDKNIDLKKSKADKYKADIIKIKNENQEQQSQCHAEILNMSDSIKMQRSCRDMKTTNKKATQTSDTQPIMKQRLKNLIHKNKQKIRIIELYRKNMEKIEQSFQVIKEDIGIDDLEEITQIFLKQQEQNTFIFEYVHKLGSELESINEQNHILKEKIQKQEEKNTQYRLSLSGTPQQKKRQMQIRKFLEQKNEPIKNTNDFIRKIEKTLLDTLGENHIEDGNILSAFNIQEYLAKIQQKINEKVKNQQIVEVDDSKIKQDTTKYSRVVPVFAADEVKDRAEQNILEPEKLRDYASYFWDKKKNSR